MPLTATVIDKPVGLDSAGRVVIPKAIRDSLQIRPGEPLKIEVKGDEIIIRRDYPKVHLKQIDGWWVICGGPPMDFSEVDLIAQVRDERIRALGGE